MTSRRTSRALFASVATLDASLGVMAGLVETLVIDRHRMREAAEEGYTTATALADALVLRGVPFRAAHHIVGGLVGGAEAEGIRTLAGLPDEAFRAALDGSDDPTARHLAKERKIAGSPARGGDDRGVAGFGGRHRRHGAGPRGGGPGGREGAPRGRLTPRPSSARSHPAPGPPASVVHDSRHVGRSGDRIGRSPAARRSITR